ncbi:MAG: winged helix-turn-helix domain-containing protein [Lachnospiraceae bacterium]
MGCGSRQVRLSGREYDLAEYFFRNPELVLSKEQITEAVWGGESEAEYNQTEVYISFLRRKLRFLGTKARLVTLRGAGYSLQPEEGREQ